MAAVSFNSGAVNQPVDLLCGAQFPPGSSFSSLGAGLSRSAGLEGHLGAVDLQQLTPARGRLGIEEVPFQGQDPIPTIVVPPPPGGWGPQATREDDLQRFLNRNTQGLDGGGRSTNITRFQPQLTKYQQDDDLARHRMFERNAPSQAKSNYPAFP
jgi:hypothetical protein